MFYDPDEFLQTYVPLIKSVGWMLRNGDYYSAEDNKSALCSTAEYIAGINDYPFEPSVGYALLNKAFWALNPYSYMVQDPEIFNMYHQAYLVLVRTGLCHNSRLQTHYDTKIKEHVASAVHYCHVRQQETTSEWKRESFGSMGRSIRQELALFQEDGRFMSVNIKCAQSQVVDLYDPALQNAMRTVQDVTLKTQPSILLDMN
jgi:hypothetical protein